MPEGTLFPSLDGSDPGEVAPTADITDVQLPPLFPQSEPTVYAPVEDPMNPGVQQAPPPPAQSVQIPGYEAPGQPPADVSIIDPNPRQEPPAPRRGLREKIATLVGQTGRQDGSGRYAEEQLAQITDALLKQGRVLEQLTSGRTSHMPAPVNQIEGDVDPITGQAANMAPAPQPVSATDIERIITGAIQNYDSQLRQQQQQITELQVAQEQSYNNAVADVPGLSDPNSVFSKTFQEVWRQSPLNQLPDGPYHVALQVQGLLAAEQQANASLTERKRQASVSVPQPTATDELGVAQKTALTQEYARLSQAIKAGNRDADLMMKFRKLGRALGRTQMRAQ